MAALGALFSQRLYPIPMELPRITATLAAAVACFLIGASLNTQWMSVVARIGLALFFCAMAWGLAFDDSDRVELRKVVGL